MRPFKLLYSSLPNKGGFYYISSTPPEEGGIDVTHNLQRLKFSEKSFLTCAKSVVESTLGLKKSHQRERTIYTIDLYETENGTLVEIAEDDFFGIVVESKDKQIIDRIFAELKKYQADELPPK